MNNEAPSAAGSLIDGSEIFILLGLLTAIVAAAVAAERTRIGRQVSAPVMITITAAVLSTLQILPTASALYDAIWQFAIPLAVPLLLLRADIRRTVREGGLVLAGFVLGTAGAIAGGFAGAALLDLSGDGSKIASALAASWIGGSVNFVATAEALAPIDGSVVTAALAADAIAGNLFFLTLMIAASLAATATGAKRLLASDTSGEKDSEPTLGTPFTLESTVLVWAISAGICGIGFAVERFVAFPGAAILVISLLALVLANLIPSKLAKLSGDFESGMFLMFLFFAALGAGTNLAAAANAAPTYLLFLAVVAGTQISLASLGAALFKVRIPELLVGINACALGPATAAAMAGAKGWKSLVAPAVLCGVLGYAIGTFFGVSLYYIMAGT